MRHNMSDVQVDFTAGLFAGMTANFVSHPMDTMKARIQLSNETLTIRRAFGNIYHSEGVRGFYRGVMSPVLGRSPLAGVMWANLGFAKRKLQKHTSLGPL